MDQNHGLDAVAGFKVRVFSWFGSQQCNIQMQSSNFEKVKILGEGTYGKCYLVLDKNKNELCVLKQIEIMGMSQEEVDESVRQARILQSLNHPCIIKFLGSFQSAQGYLNIVMSYADGGDLNQKIKEVKLKQEVFPESQIVHWFVQVCLALQHVHERKIIHRDIKTQNVFLTKEGNVKLGDFGIARPLQLTLQKIKSVVGTPYYMSPEICQNKEYTTKTDIWSLGVILLEMCLLKPPFDAGSLPALALKITKGEYISVPKQYSKNLKQLVSQMMQVDPVKRPTIQEVLASPLLRDKAGFMRFKDKNESQVLLLQELSLAPKKSSGSSRGLFIECNSEDQSMVEQVISPKSQMAKHHDMPVKRVDNYMNFSKGEKKSQKKGDQLKRRDVSEPILTPKNHMKIENEKKVMVKNHSQLNFQKKRQNSNSGPTFKKKTKCNQDIVKSLEEINEVKNDIYSLQDQISYREKEVSPPMNIAELEDQLSESSLESPEETPLEMVESMIKAQMSQDEYQSLSSRCESKGGVCDEHPLAGLLTLAFGLKNG